MQEHDPVMNMGIASIVINPTSNLRTGSLPQFPHLR
jgi:hypothetical protein